MTLHFNTIGSEGMRTYRKVLNVFPFTATILKLTLWLRKKKFVYVVNVFLLFCFYLLLKKRTVGVKSFTLAQVS